MNTNQYYKMLCNQELSARLMHKEQRYDIVEWVKKNHRGFKLDTSTIVEGVYTITFSIYGFQICTGFYIDPMHNHQPSMWRPLVAKYLREFRKDSRDKAIYLQTKLNPFSWGDK